MNAVWRVDFQNFDQKCTICGIRCACFMQGTYLRSSEFSEARRMEFRSSRLLARAWSTIRGPDLGFQESGFIVQRQQSHKKIDRLPSALGHQLDAFIYEQYLPGYAMWQSRVECPCEARKSAFVRLCGA